MAQSLISRVVNSNCHTRSLTIRHLTRKLKRLNQRIERSELSNSLLKPAPISVDDNKKGCLEKRGSLFEVENKAG